jgi:hypothetical protein
MQPRPTPGSEWSFRDVLFGLMVSFMALAVLALAAAPPKPLQASPPGRLLVTLTWQHDRDIDVDLWAKGPDDAEPVGYSHRTDRTFDLLHDDRGRAVECQDQPPTCEDANTEIAVARSLPAGLWHINAVAFGSHDHVYPVHVWITVDLIDQTSHNTTRLFRRDGDLHEDHDEVTLLNFRTNDAGAIVPGSDNDLPYPLWHVVQ